MFVKPPYPKSPLFFDAFIATFQPMGIVATGGVDLSKPEKFSPGSKFIELVEYNPKDNTMDLTFRSGSKRRYLQVFPTTFLSFKQSPTIDAFYARAIKGNLMSVSLVDKNIGRKESTPLKPVKKERTLDPGLKSQQSRNERIAGTIARAFSAL
jgi:hypothetical protein